MNRFRKPILFLCDSTIFVGVTVVLSLFSLRYSLTDAVGQGLLPVHMLLLFACTVIFQLLFRTYDSLWRYAESKEYLFLLLAALCGFGLYEVLSRFVIRGSVISFLLLTAIASLWVLGMLMIRFAYRVYRSYVMQSKGIHRTPVAIVGAGAAGVQLLHELQNNPDSKYKVECFFDDDPGKIHKCIHGIEVKGKISEIPARLKAMDIREIIVAIPSAGELRRREILEKLSNLDRVKITVLPSTLDLMAQKTITSRSLGSTAIRTASR